MKKIVFEGGFHNRPTTFVRVTEEQIKQFKAGEYLWDILSDSQMQRLDRHFCGIKGCLCGGVFRTKRWIVG